MRQPAGRGDRAAKAGNIRIKRIERRKLISPYHEADSTTRKKAIDLIGSIMATQYGCNNRSRFDAGNGRLKMLGFVDDSGSGGGTDRGNIFVLAGFVASPERWERFSREWMQICDQEPRTPDFHIQRDVRLLNKDGSVRWTAQQRDSRIEDLVKLTKSLAQYRVESTLAWPNYDRVVKGKIPPYR